MPSETPRDDAGRARVMLGLLESVERDGSQSQRRLAAELGIAVGLVNAYLKRCIKKGLIKVSEAPPRRYAYYLTPHGFAEKSQLTVAYLSYSFSFFRQARADCSSVIRTAQERGWSRVVLMGASDLAEIARICALESSIGISAVVDAHAEVTSFVGLPVVPSFDHVLFPFDGVIITDVHNARRAFAAAAEQYGAPRVLAPKLLGLNDKPRAEVAS